ncbi:MAG: cytochrome c oxidase assembly protein [Alphaproteobacteria bacterium]|nr:cytochrome c oxidase assembly protein [Alphaproteobacteria bacterium]
MAIDPGKRRNLGVAATAIAVSFTMLGLAYASVPLYRLFCQVTGFGGTTQRADAAPQHASDKSIVIRFDANTASSLGWSFHAAQAPMTVKIGEQNMAHYRATNRTRQVSTGSAVFNVTPVSAGAYFNKIECFCFTEQTLKPGESADMPVVFFVDPGILEDPETQSVGEITLSYTFYPVNKPQAVSAASNAAGVTN